MDNQKPAVAALAFVSLLCASPAMAGDAYDATNLTTLSVKDMPNVYIHTKDGGGFWATIPSRDMALLRAREICADHPTELGYAGSDGEWRLLCAEIERKWSQSGAAERSSKIDEERTRRDVEFVKRTAAE